MIVVELRCFDVDVRESKFIYELFDVRQKPTRCARRKVNAVYKCCQISGQRHTRFCLRPIDLSFVVGFGVRQFPHEQANLALMLEALAFVYEGAKDVSRVDVFGIVINVPNCTQEYIFIFNDALL